MRLEDVSDTIRAIHRKTIDVIMSGKNFEHHEGSRIFVDLAKIRLDSFKFKMKKEKSVILNIKKNIDILLNLKGKMIRHTR